ncbi:MAG: hypothetical protein ABEN55_02680, partial [Bradymonadaceae bacterium]
MAITKIKDKQIDNSDGRFLESDGSVSLDGGYTPSGDDEIATLGWSRGFRDQMDNKGSVRAATTASLGLGSYPNSSISSLLDGVRLNGSDRVLIKDEATADYNGLAETSFEDLIIQDLTYTASTERNVEIVYTDPNTSSSSLTLNTTQGAAPNPHKIEVNLATDSNGNLTSSANDIESKINNDATASGWVSVSGGGSTIQSAQPSTFFKVELARTSNFDSLQDVSRGDFVMVETGSTNGKKGFVVTDAPVNTFGSEPIQFSRYSGTATMSGGDGISVSGDTVSVATTGGGLSFSSGSLTVSVGSFLKETSGGLDIQTLPLRQYFMGGADGNTGVREYIKGEVLADGLSSGKDIWHHYFFGAY